MSKKTSIKEMAVHIRRKLGLGKQENKKIQRIKNDFKERTSEMGEEWDLGDFLMLLDLAEYGKLGKSNAIIFAFKIGYLQGYDDLRVKTLKWLEETFGIKETEDC